MCFCNNMLETQSCNIHPSVSINMVRMQNILIVKVSICVWTLTASVAGWREEQPWSSYCLSREPEPFTKDIPSCEWIDVIFNRVRLSLSGSMSDRWVTRRGEKNTAIFSFIYKSPANVGDMRYYLSVRFLERVFALWAWWKFVFNKESAHQEQIQNTHNRCVCLSVCLTLPTKA